MPSQNGQPTHVAAARRSARKARLKYVSDSRPGIRRRRSGKGFAYFSSRDQRVRRPATLERIGQLAIPPAWTDVWICPSASGHLQATGRDDRGRKQYKYHSRWNHTRDNFKYERMISFAEALPRIRRRIARDLRRRGLDREKVLAAMGWLLDRALLRVGGEEYERDNNSFGLATIKSRHATIRGDEVKLLFRSKSSKIRDVQLTNARMAGIVRRCQDLPGQDLFQYRAEGGEIRDVKSQDVNNYLREVSGGEFTAKDFRTWAATTLAIACLRDGAPADSESTRKREVTRTLSEVADRLGNTPAVCRKSYIQPSVLEAYVAGELKLAGPAKRVRGLMADEEASLAVLRRLSGPSSRNGHRRST